jgi:hypothetical protein
MVPGENPVMARWGERNIPPRLESRPGAKPMPILWRPWGDPLPDNAPADVANCQSYSRWLARQRGDAHTEDEEGRAEALGSFLRATSGP